MKTHLNVHYLNFPLKKIIRTNLREIHSITAITLSLKTESGETGYSFIPVLGNQDYLDITEKIKIIHQRADTKNSLINLDQWKKFWFDFQKTARDKATSCALATLDIAAWDLFTKNQKQPLHKLLNTNAPKALPIYGTTGWLSLSEKELIQECEKYAAMNIYAFKIRLGHQNDEKRVAAVRKAMGDDFTLMLDATELFTVDEAVEISARMSAYNILWLEEPIKHSIESLQYIKNKSAMQIATGENIRDLASFSVLAKSRAVDILQPDILHLGGITGFTEALELAKKYELPTCNHLLPELSFNVLSTFSNAYYVEYDDLLPNDIFIHQPVIKNGYIYPLNNSSGTGIVLTEKAMKTYEIK